MRRPHGVRLVAALAPVFVPVLVSGLVSGCSGGGSTDAAASPAARGGSPTGTVSVHRDLGRYQPLWPFASIDEARAWQRSYRSGGHGPWHLSAEQTALAFAGYLGFTEVDQVTSRTVDDGEAHIGIGSRTAEGTGTAAVVHLIRIGDGADAPWEVVGTDDSELSLTTPAYGAVVSSPVAVGGRITGVDESLRLAVRQRSSSAPIGRFCCVPAGGFPGQWSAKVPFRGASEPVLTIVVSTGGHVAEVERFAVTGVRPG
jgi:hypothetical protein